MPVQIKSCRRHADDDICDLRFNGQTTATNIQTDVAKLKPIRAKVEEEYDFLSEHTHPAGFGTVLYFAERQKTEDAYIFDDGGPDPEADLQWIMVGIKLLEGFEEALKRIEAALPELSARGHTENK